MHKETALRRIFLISWVLSTLLSAAWALATPIAAAPDEPAHMIKAASVVRGELIGVASQSGHVVHVPRFLADTHERTCYAFKSYQPADCEVPSGDPTELVEAKTTAGLYNPLYYVSVGWPTLFLSGDTAIYTMRIVSGAVTMLFLSLSVTMISAWKRPALPLMGLLVGMTPVFLFLSGTVNPNGLEASATVSLFVGMLSIVLNPNRERLRLLCTLVAISAAVALNTRGLAAVWVLLAIAVPLCVAKWHSLRDLFKRREVLWAVAAVAVATAISLIWLFGSSSLFAGLDPEGPSTVPWAGSSPLSGWWLVITGTFDYGQQMVGLFGWLDTPTADLVYFVWAVFTGAFAVTALVLTRGSRLLASLALIAAFVVVPALIQAAYITGGGLIWQGRYNLPAYFCMMIGLAAFIAHDLPSGIPRSYSRRLTLVVTSTWGAMQVLAFATTLQRYAVGLEGTWIATLRRPEWSAPLGNAVTIVVFAMLLCIVVLAVDRWHLERYGPKLRAAEQAPLKHEPSEP